MAAKIHDYHRDSPAGGEHLYAFHCPGCGYDHAFRVGGSSDRPKWNWNGNMDRPTFTPSLLCNKDTPEVRCHSFVSDGRIQFLADCWHALKGQTVDIPDYESQP